MLTEIVWLAGLLSVGFFLVCLACGLGIAGDKPWALILAFALGVSLAWPVFVALLLLLAALFAAGLVLYMPVLLFVAIRGKHPLVRVTKTGEP